nr:MAG TPA: hypothetical protein [Caudoviricetes sp.]
MLSIIIHLKLEINYILHIFKTFFQRSRVLVNKTCNFRK